MNADAPENLLGEWARLVAATLVAQGVTDVVVSPGSRSTPYVAALATAPGLACVDVIDERAAAFVALGASRATGRPTALLCTSGTAVAHWFPAVVEASMAEVPLLLLSADRPFELVGCGAPQTIDQLKLFGDHVRDYVETGTPEAAPSALRGLRAALVRAIALARGPRPGPVHVNLRARKPLEPQPASTPEGHALRARVDALLEAPAPRVATRRVSVDARDVEPAAALLAKAHRPLVVAGPMPLTSIADGARDAALDVVRATGAPLFSETTSQLRFIDADGVARVDALDLALGRGLPAGLEPDLVLSLGGTPVASGVERFLAARPGLARVVAGVGAYTDPLGSAHALLLGDAATTLRALADALVGHRPSIDVAWRDALSALDARLRAMIVGARDDEALGEGRVAAAVARSVPRGGVLTVGNSLPIRMLDRFAHEGEADAIGVVSQRGANGIDGLVAGAIGASRATGVPGALLLGDVSALHDVGALASAHLTRAPLVVVIAQNGGGRIFETLPVAKAPSTAGVLAHFTTPTTVRFGALADAFGVPFASASTPASLDRALAEAWARPGLSIVEAVVPPHGAAALLARLDADAAALLR